MSAEYFKNEKSLQDQFAPKSVCFGCGPANKSGLQIKSFIKGSEVLCRWKGESHHQAFPGILNGGIIGAILDCHSNWTAAYFIMKQHDLSEPLCTVTASYSVQLKRPTPINQDLILRAKVLDLTEKKAIVKADLIADGKLCATCEGTFVAVKEGHPAYHRWNG